MKPLVMVHGFMGGSAQWAEETACLSDIREVIAIDLPGFGANSHLDPIDTIGGFADWMIAELDSRNVQTFDLLGHSMGGKLAMQLATSQHSNGYQKLTFRLLTSSLCVIQ